MRYKNSWEEESMKTVKQSRFPFNLVHFHQYDGMKTIVALILALSFCYFLTGMWTLFTWENSWFWPDSIHKLGVFGFHFFLFTIVYCIAWLTFDRASMEGYVVSIFSCILGAVYIMSPFDFVPDLIPGLSTIDDALIGGGSMFFAALIGQKARKRNSLTEEVTRLIEEGNHFESLRLLLRERGVVLEKDS